MDKLDPKTDGASPDIAEENIEKLRELFPDAFTEGSDPNGPRWKVDFDALQQILGNYVEDRDERYSLAWHGKSRARQIAQTPSNGTLRPCPEESVNWESSENLFIDGDNLEVLKLLQKSYHKQVKIIYIDPPYNTGSEFIYPDRFQDNIDNYFKYTGQTDIQGLKLSSNSESSGRFHTNWLNMMYPRLRLARNLLKDDGVIFISIDDNEVHNLRHIMDEIYGPENFVATIVWHKMDSPKNSARHLSEDHDYILLYAKNSEKWRPNLIPRSKEMEARYRNPDDDPRGPWLLGDLAARNQYAKGIYPITTPTGRVIQGPPAGSYWRISKEKFQELDEDGRIWWGESGNNRPGIKKFLNEVKQGVVPQTYWHWKEVGSTRNAKQEISKILQLEPGDLVFDTPKPVGLVRRILQIASNADGSDILLDFFTGSASSAEAVMRMNSEDGGNRRHLSVQLPEPMDSGDYSTIADMAKARLRSARESIMTQVDTADRAGGVAHNSGLDLGFKVFRLSSSNIRPWDPSSNDIAASLFDTVENIKSDRKEADLLYELLLKYGLDLAVPIEQRQLGGETVYIIGAGALVVCLADAIDLDVVKGIASLKEELSPEVMRVVFKDNGFKDDVVKTNTVQILRQAGIEDVKSL